MKTTDIKTASTAELLAFYNAHSGRDPIIRFADRKVAEKRVRLIIEQIEGIDSPISEPEAEQPVKLKKATKVVKVAKATKAAKPTKQPKPKPEPRDREASRAQRAESIAKSWKDPAVHAARSARNACRVSGTTYSSVAAAFAVLKLDMKKHQRVRREMVLNGHTSFDGHRFTLAKE